MGRKKGAQKQGDNEVDTYEEVVKASPSQPKPKAKANQKEQPVPQESAKAKPKAKAQAKPAPQESAKAKPKAKAQAKGQPSQPASDASEKPKSKTNWTIEDHPKALKVIRFSYPIYGIQWFAANRLFIGGGGGQRYGMPNQLVAASFKTAKKVNLTITSIYDSQQTIIWSVGTANPKAKTVLAGHMNSISLLKLTDGQKIENVSTLPVLSKEGNESRKYAVMSPCGNIAIVAQDDNTLACVQVENDIMTLRQDALVGHGDRITDISISQFPQEIDDSKGPGKKVASVLVATTSEDRSLRLWQVPIAAPKGTKLSQIGSINTADIRQDKSIFKFCRLDNSGTKLYAVSTGMGAESFITLFNIEPNQEEGKKAPRYKLQKELHVKVTTNSITAFSMSSDGTYIVCGDNEGVVYALKTPDLKVVFSRKDLHDCPVTSISVNWGNKIIASADLDAVVKFYEVAPPSKFSYYKIALVLAILAVIVQLARVYLF